MAPAQVIVVSGHLTDAVDRPVPRFPEEMVRRVDAEIGRAFDEWDVDASTTLICGGARGADLLAAERALAAGAAVRLCLALPAEEFIERSVRRDGTDWEQRFRSVAAKARVDVLPGRHNGDEVFARTNAWMVEVARALHPSPRAVVVWNGQPGDGPGGANDMLERFRGTGTLTADRVRVIDPTPRAYEARQAVDGPKRILTLDGGGIRGVLSLEVLLEIEAQLRNHYSKPDFVLSDYFDYIAGTSTGAIIAAGLALGHSVDDILERYLAIGHKVFRKQWLPLRWWSLYDERGLAEELDGFLGAHRRLGDQELKTLLLLVMHNTETDSPWPVSNCTRAHYNLPERLLCHRSDRNLDIPLVALVRASSAAPLYFRPAQLPLGNGKIQFQDGGITPYNNPAMLAVMMATLPEYGLEWPAGEGHLLVVSVGTGTSAAVHPRLRRGTVNALFNAVNLPSVFMNGASFGQDLVCRAVGACRVGMPLDREVGDRVGRPPIDHHPLFAYARYDADLGAGALEQQLGILDRRSQKRLRKLDAVEEIPTLREIGREVAKRVDVRTHFSGFLG